MTKLTRYERLKNLDSKLNYYVTEEEKAEYQGGLGYIGTEKHWVQSGAIKDEQPLSELLIVPTVFGGFNEKGLMMYGQDVDELEENAPDEVRPLTLSDIQDMSVYNMDRPPELEAVDLVGMYGVILDSLKHQNIVEYVIADSTKDALYQAFKGNEKELLEQMHELSYLTLDEIYDQVALNLDMSYITENGHVFMAV